MDNLTRHGLVSAQGDGTSGAGGPGNSDSIVRSQPGRESSASPVILPGTRGLAPRSGRPLQHQDQVRPVLECALRSRFPGEFGIRLQGVVILAVLILGACKNGAGPSPDSAPVDSAPSVTGHSIAWNGSPASERGSSVHAAGDTIRFVIEAWDPDGRLTWIGVRFAEPYLFVDSFPVPDSLASGRVALNFWLATSADFAGLLRVAGFARDAAGHRTEVELEGNPVSIYSIVARPAIMTPLSDPVGDVTFDVRRNLVYLAQPQRGRIAPLSLATMTFLPVIAPPGPPGSMDLVASGDSLLVSVPSLRAVAVADLTGASPRWSLLDLTFDTSAGRHAKTLRVSARNKALIFIGPAAGYSGWMGHLLEYDLTLGVQRVRTDVNPDAQGMLTDRTPMASSLDRSRILLLFDNACCPETGRIYESQADAFLPSRGTVQLYFPPLSASATGNAFLVGRTVFNQALEAPIPFNTPGQFWVPSTVSQSGDTVYFAYGPGVFRTRVADGATLELTLLPEPAARLFSVPGPGERLLVLSDNGVSLVDLAGSAGVSAGRSASVIPLSRHVRAGRIAEAQVRPAAR